MRDDIIHSCHDASVDVNTHGRRAHNSHSIFVIDRSLCGQISSLSRPNIGLSLSFAVKELGLGLQFWGLLVIEHPQNLTTQNTHKNVTSNNVC